MGRESKSEIAGFLCFCLKNTEELEHMYCTTADVRKVNKLLHITAKVNKSLHLDGFLFKFLDSKCMLATFHHPRPRDTSLNHFRFCFCLT